MTNNIIVTKVQIKNLTKRCTNYCEICKLENYIHPLWANKLYFIINSNYFKKIKINLHKNIYFYPKTKDIFKFTYYTPLEAIKIVILGQDPYHNPGEAMGLAFSVPENVKIPTSLKTIFKEISRCYKEYEIPKDGSLINWAKQGVLLLNYSLTVLKNKPNSHSKIGWDIVTREIIRIINCENKNVVFMLWGKNAMKHASLITNTNHLILKGAHPIPSIYGRFMGCNHFLMANEYLEQHNLTPIKW